MCVPGIYNGIYVLIKIIQDVSVCVCAFACGYGICIDDLRRSSLFALEPQRFSLFSSLLLTTS